MAARYISRSLASIISIQSLDASDRDSARNILEDLRRDARNSARRHALPRSKNDHGIANSDEIFHSGGVPVCQSDATVTRGATYGLWIIRPVNPNARSVQTHPENADEIVRTGRKIVIILGVRVNIENKIIIAKPWSNVNSEDFTCFDRSRYQFKSRCTVK